MPYAVAAVFVLTGLLLLFLGYLIRFRRMTHLIAGYNRERVRDEGGLARWVGGCVLAMGGLVIVAGLGALNWPDALAPLTLFLSGSVGALTVLAAWGARRFEKSTSAS